MKIKNFMITKSKTSALAQLENNLIIDLEGGSQFIDAMAVQARSVNGNCSSHQS